MVKASYSQLKREFRLMGCVLILLLSTLCLADSSFISNNDKNAGILDNFKAKMNASPNFKTAEERQELVDLFANSLKGDRQAIRLLRTKGQELLKEYSLTGSDSHSPLPLPRYSSAAQKGETRSTPSQAEVVVIDGSNVKRELVFPGKPGSGKKPKPLPSAKTPSVPN